MAVLTPEEISDFIRNSLLGPKAVSVGEERFEQHSVGDLIKALQFSLSQNAIETGSGLIFKQLVPPGGGGTP